MLELETDSVEKLEKGLRVIQRPHISENARLRLKNRIMGRINDPVQTYVQSLISEVSLSMEQKACIKERVFAIIEGRMQKKFFFRNLVLFHKKVFSVLTMFALGLSMFVFVNVDTAVVRAQSVTQIATFDGSITVERNGRVLEVYSGMEIKENDTILTGSDGAVTIKYFEDSVSRLAANTELVINKLLKMNDSTAKSYVEVSLVDGTVWSRVVNLVEEESAFVVKSNEVSTSLREGALNVASDEGAVDVKVYGLGTVADSANDEWVQGNLKSDEKYLLDKKNEILLAKMESIGIEGVDDVSLKKTLREEALLLLTFDDVKKKKVELDLAERNFVAIQIKLENGNLGDDGMLEAHSVINEFASMVKDFRAFIAEVELSDKVFAGSLRTYLEAKVLVQKKYLRLINENHPAFIAREAVDGLDQALDEGDLKVGLDSVDASDLVIKAPSVVSVPVVSVPGAIDIAEEYDVGVQGDKLLSPFVDF